MDIPDILGILGFALALGLGVFEIFRYHYPLRLRIREVDLVGKADDRIYLILLRVTFVNPSMSGRTVYHLVMRTLGDAKVAPPAYRYEEGHNTVIYAIPNMKGVEVPLSSNDILQLPLDIPPHQSRSAWLATLVKMEKDTQYFDLVLDAQDVSLKSIAKFEEQIELRTYTVHQPSFS